MATLNSTDGGWTRHPDGKPKKIGEMTSEETGQVTRDAVARLQPKFAAMGVHLAFKEADTVH